MTHCESHLPYSTSDFSGEEAWSPTCSPFDLDPVIPPRDWDNYQPFPTFCKLCLLLGLLHTSPALSLNCSRFDFYTAFRSQREVEGRNENCGLQLQGDAVTDWNRSDEETLTRSQFSLPPPSHPYFMLAQLPSQGVICPYGYIPASLHQCYLAQVGPFGEPTVQRPSMPLGDHSEASGVPARLCYLLLPTSGYGMQATSSFTSHDQPPPGNGNSTVPEAPPSHQESPSTSYSSHPEEPELSPLHTPPSTSRKRKRVTDSGNEAEEEGFFQAKRACVAMEQHLPGPSCSDCSLTQPKATEEPESSPLHSPSNSQNRKTESRSEEDATFPTKRVCMEKEPEESEYESTPPGSPERPQRCPVVWSRPARRLSLSAQILQTKKGRRERSIREDEATLPAKRKCGGMWPKKYLLLRYLEENQGCLLSR